MSERFGELELLRCPICKGPLASTVRKLDCRACQATYRWDSGLECWDLRPWALAARPARHECERRPRMRRVGVAAREARMWRALLQGRGDPPRQGRLLRIDAVTQPSMDETYDAFRHRIHFVTTRTAGIRSSGRVLMDPPPLALVETTALPIASECIDLIDADVLTPADPALDSRLAEVHRVLASRGHAFVTGEPGMLRTTTVELAARAAFAEGYAWLPRGIERFAPGRRFATLHRHFQAWVGFEYTLGRGVQTARRSGATTWLAGLHQRRELICWRTRPTSSDWKSTASDEAMTFGRFHFPASASST